MTAFLDTTLEARPVRPAEVRRLLQERVTEPTGVFAEHVGRNPIARGPELDVQGFALRRPFAGWPVLAVRKPMFPADDLETVVEVPVIVEICSSRRKESWKWSCLFSLTIFPLLPAPQ